MRVVKVANGLLAATLAGLVIVLPAAACSPVPELLRTQQQIDDAARQCFERQYDLVSVLTIEPVTDRKPGKARILRSFKKRTRVGSIVMLSTLSGSMCGFGDVRQNELFTIYLSDPGRTPLHPVSYSALAHLASLGLIPQI